MKDWSEERRREWHDDRRHREDGIRLLSENPDLAPFLELFLDIKCFAQGTRLQDLSPAARAALRAIRQGSGNRLGNPPAL